MLLKFELEGSVGHALSDKDEEGLLLTKVYGGSTLAMSRICVNAERGGRLLHTLEKTLTKRTSL